MIKIFQQCCSMSDNEVNTEEEMTKLQLWTLKPAIKYEE